MNSNLIFHFNKVCKSVAKKIIKWSEFLKSETSVKNNLNYRKQTDQQDNRSQVLWPECDVPPEIHMLKPNPQCDGVRRWRPWGDWILRMEPSWMGFVPLWNRAWELSHCSGMWGPGEGHPVWIWKWALPDMESSSPASTTVRDEFPLILTKEKKKKNSNSSKALKSDLS